MPASSSDDLYIIANSFAFVNTFFRFFRKIFDFFRKFSGAGVDISVKLWYTWHNTVKKRSRFRRAPQRESGWCELLGKRVSKSLRSGVGEREGTVFLNSLRRLASVTKQKECARDFFRAKSGGTACSTS